MFKNLMDFGYKRSRKEAVGFYIAYLFLTMIIGALLGGLFSLAGMGIGGLQVGSLSSVFISLALAFLVLKNKKLLRNFKFVMLALLAGLLSLFLGGFGGLIPAAYFTTKENPADLQESVAAETPDQTPDQS